MSRILITDAEQRSSLAAVRSLGRAGHHVIVCSSEPKPLAGASRSCRGTHVVADPCADATGFVDAIQRLVETESLDLVIPMTDVSSPLVLSLRERCPGLLIPFPQADAYARASNKLWLLSEAASIGIPVPRQEVVARWGDTFAPGPNLKYPLVLKPSRSAVMVDNRVAKLSVCVVDSPDQLANRLHAYPDHAFPMLVQEQIVGPGLGAFLLSQDGVTVATFGHRRLREKPPAGGVSVYRESIPLRDDIKEYSERLLARLAWSGAAMVEFKEDRATGIPYLMEVNARFWGSLQLAIDAGVDFPELLVRMATGGTIPRPPDYRFGIRSRWLWGDLDHLLAILGASPEYRSSHPELPSRVGALARFLVPWRRGDRFEVLRITDPWPFFRESQRWFGAVRVAMRMGERRGI